jgi:K(+)-stimulated pyrophosphate-energized sodium pump
LEGIWIWITLAISVVGVGVAIFLAWWVLKQTEGSNKVAEIASAIREGASAFLGREYKLLAIFVAVVFIVLTVVPSLGWRVGVTFLFGALTSGLSGFIGMKIATNSNSRTAAAAEKSLNSGLKVAFRAGSVMGISVVSVGLLGLSLIFIAFYNSDQFLSIIPAYGFGASTVAIFSRVGGGIFTKAADTGADIVGKVEQNIPEDDPRNAAVIADCVGDNVGDVAGMGADLSESYVDSIIATVTLSSVALVAGASGSQLVPSKELACLLPMLIAAAGIVSSLIGIFLVRVGEKLEMTALLNALRKGTWVSTILAAILAFVIIYFLKVDLGVYWAILCGLVAGVLIGESTNFFTSYVYSPTKNVSKSGQTGAATVIISGFANGLMSTLPPVIIIGIAILLANHFGGVYGVAIAGVGMLATLGIQDATDAYGPIADNAGGIVEMSGLPHEIRDRTDALDSLGNTTAATGKGFAVGSAALTALALLLSYTNAVDLKASEVNLLDANIIVGLFLGALLPAVFCALTMSAVGKTGFSIVNEVRRQFKEIPGLLEGKAKADYKKCVDICTRDSLKEMILPGVITVLTPIVVGFVLGKQGLAGFLTGSTVTGFILAVTFSNAGGSWDNAKKYVETGEFGGKGSDTHKATVIGDTVGDPMKDTSGPALNIMIKLASIIAVVLAPVIANMTGLF